MSHQDEHPIDVSPFNNIKLVALVLKRSSYQVPDGIQLAFGCLGVNASKKLTPFNLLEFK